MGCSQIINALKLEAGHVLKGTDNDTLKTKAEYINNAVAPLEAHLSEEKKILSNLSLTQQGQMEALKKLGTTTTAPALSWIRKTLKGLREKEQHYRTQFYTVDSKIKDLAERLPIFIYLWNKLDVLDPSARIKRFALAAEADEVKVIAAMLDHPEGPMVTDEVKERVLYERAKRLTPRDVTNFEQNQILIEFLTMARDWIALWLVKEVGVEPSAIRANFGDEVADALADRSLTPEPQLTGASR